MKALGTFTDSLYIAWTIARKDIGEMLKNKNTRVNIVILLGMIVFFYWMSTPRPFDKRINVVVYDEGKTSLAIENAKLEDGTEFIFYEASSFEDMKRKMAYKELGLILPVDFDQILESGGEPGLEGYVLWAHRSQAADLENKYSEKFTQLLGRPLRIHIGDNIVVPYPDVETNSIPFHVLFITLWLSISTVPHLMFEERKNKTIEALWVSPASPSQVILGKALAGMFYITLAGILFFILNGVYVVNWGLAILGFCTIALLGIGFALLLGGIIQSAQQLSLWALCVAVLLIVPVLFVNEPFLASWLKSTLVWLPTAAMAKLVQFSFSSSASAAQLGLNLGITFASILLIFGLVVWQNRKLDR
jgi:ABC-2 type transport system permease protein